MRYWILDRDETPQGLPLLELVRRVRTLVPDESLPWHVTKARGYGERVVELDEILDREMEVLVDPEEIERLAAGREEWFYDFSVQTPDRKLILGLHDSTALFVEGDDEVARSVAATFARFQAAKPGG